MEMLHLTDIDVVYTKTGEGPPCVLIHGLAEDRRSWQFVQEELAEFTTYAVDFRGHGETSLGEGNGTLAQLGEDLIAFMDAVTGPARCVGYSLGGTIVLWAAARRPDLVPHAVVTGTSAVVGRTAAGFFDERIHLLTTDPAQFAVALRHDTALQLVRDDTDLDAVTARRLEAVGDGGGYINAARAMAGLRATPLLPDLERISAPVDVIGADGDAFCPRRAADMLCEALREATYHEIADAGHLMSVDQPLAYAAAIKQALLRRKSW